MATKSLNLADIVRQDVRAASIDAMDHFADGGKMVAADRTLEQIAADIVRKDQQVGLGLISIGNDLLEAKGKVEHGKWGEWLDLNVGYSERKAQMCMQIARRYGSNPQLVADLGIRKVTALMLLPAGEDAEFLETHDVPNMSTRELEDAIRERDEAKAEAERLEKERDAALAQAKKDAEYFEKASKDADRYCDEAAKYEREVKRLRTKVTELESAPKEVYQDEAAIQKAADEARKESLKELEKAHQERLDAENEVRLLQKELVGARRAAQDAQAGSDAPDEDVVAFRIHLDTIRDTVNRLRGLVLKVKGRDAALGEKMERRLNDLLFEVS